MLWWVASIRFAMQPTDPPRPVPDYAVQMTWGFGAIPVVFLIAVVMGGVAAHRPKSRQRVVVLGCCAMVLAAALAAALALILSSTR